MLHCIRMCTGQGVVRVRVRSFQILGNTVKMIKMLGWRYLNCCYQNGAWMMREVNQLAKFAVWNSKRWSRLKREVWELSLWAWYLKSCQTQLRSQKRWESKVDLCLYQRWVFSDFGKSCFCGTVREKSLIKRLKKE